MGNLETETMYGRERLSDSRSLSIEPLSQEVIWQANPREYNGRERNFPPENWEGLGAFIDYFDTNWQHEGLPADWYNLKRKVGFSMRGQMGLLEGTDDESIHSWLQKTKQDVKGFIIEYLSDKLVYPCIYRKDAQNPQRLIDPLYGNKDLEDVVSEKERNGSVKQSLQEMKSFFLSKDTPENAIAVMVSPKGPSGLTTDDGKKITYPDSYVFIMQKDGETVTNYTVKTDFNLDECRKALKVLTGRELPSDATLEEYVRTIALFKPGEEVQNRTASDIVHVLEKIRADNGSRYAFKETSWKEVYRDINQADNLYTFNSKAQRQLAEFEGYCMEGNHTKADLRKALAATILRISKLLLFDQAEKKEVDIPIYVREFDIYKPIPKIPVSFGRVLEEVAQRPGCAGGGNNEIPLYGVSTAVESIVPRLGITVGESSDEYGSLTFECPSCGRTNKRDPGKLITECQYKDAEKPCKEPWKVGC